MERKLSEHEHSIISEMLVFSGNFECFNEQIKNCIVKPIEKSSSILIYSNGPVCEGWLDGPIACCYAVSPSTTSEIGPFVNITLYARNGLIYMMEIYSDDEQLYSLDQLGKRTHFRCGHRVK